MSVKWSVRRLFLMLIGIDYLELCTSSQCRKFNSVVTCQSLDLSFTGALDIDEQFRVLKTDGQPLDGLYAVGTDCLGVLFTEKKEYVTCSGADQGWAFASGYLAGDGIAQTILSE